MLGTLLLRLSLHFTPLHYTCRHFTSSHLNFTQLHFTTLSFGLTPFKFPTPPPIPPHITTLHLTSLHCIFRRFSPHFCSFHFTPFITAFLTLFLKILGLQGRALNASAVSWFQFCNGPIDKGILPTIRSLLPVPNFPKMINPTQILRPSQPVACVTSYCVLPGEWSCVRVCVRVCVFVCVCVRDLINDNWYS